MSFADAADSALEALVAPSFTTIGYRVRSRAERWEPLDVLDVSGRTVVVTGGTSGLGLEAARWFSTHHAYVILVGRDQGRTESAARSITNETGRTRIEPAVADLGELDQVRALAEMLNRSRERIDVLIHNAGALSAQRIETSHGMEATVASQVVGPFLLTSLLLARLQPGAPGRVITVASGGMYTAPLNGAVVELPEGKYNGSKQYAAAKRAQVTLNEMWAERVPPEQVVFQAMHPGWANTPGVASSLPRFHRIARPLLRTVAEGADTIIWLAGAAAPARQSGGFWHDRRRRAIHRLSSTRRSDTRAQRQALWDWCVEHSGVDPSMIPTAS